MTLYVVKDGIQNVASVVDKNGNRILSTNYYALTHDFKSNEGYIELKKNKVWRLYTQIGQKVGHTRYYTELSFENCIEKLKALKGNEHIIVCDSSDIKKYCEEKTTGNNGYKK